MRTTWYTTKDMLKRALLSFVFLVFIFGIFAQPITLSLGHKEKTGSEEPFIAKGSFADQIKNIDIAPATAHAETIESTVQGKPEISFWNLMFTDMATFVTLLVYYYVAWPFILLARFSGMILDTFISLSIDSLTYREFGFIVEGWKVVRDLTNIAFIFALLLIAFSLVLNLRRVDARKLLVNVIVVALMMNFSLFFTRIAVDASNILARVFINNITLQSVDGVADTYQGSSVGYGSQPPKEVTRAILSNINPQRLLSQEVYETEIDGKQPAGSSKMLYNFFVLFILIIIHMILTYVFLVVGILFLMRIITIAISMIVAPLAMATLMFPGGKGLDEIGFDKWLSNFLKACFMAPIFLFFMYLAVQFLGTNFVQTTSNGFWIAILQTVVPFAIIIGILFAAKDIAIKMSGKAGAMVGNAVSGVAKGAIGLGLAAATGGAALAMQGTLGAAGGALAKSENVKKLKNSTAFGGAGRLVGEAAGGLGNKLNTGSFDWRKTSAGKKIVQETGFNSFGGATSFSKQTEGGFAAQKEKLNEINRIRQKDREVQDWEKPAVDLAEAEANRDKAKEHADRKTDNLHEGESLLTEDLKKLDKAITDARDELTKNRAKLADGKNADLSKPELEALHDNVKASEKKTEDAVKAKDAFEKKDHEVDQVDSTGKKIPNAPAIKVNLAKLKQEKIDADKTVSVLNANVREKKDGVEGENQKRRDRTADLMQGPDSKWARALNTLANAIKYGGLPALGMAGGMVASGAPVGLTLGAVAAGTAALTGFGSARQQDADRQELMDQVRFGFKKSDNASKKRFEGLGSKIGKTGGGGAPTGSSSKP